MMQSAASIFRPHRFGEKLLTTWTNKREREAGRSLRTCDTSPPEAFSSVAIIFAVSPSSHCSHLLTWEVKGKFEAQKLDVGLGMPSIVRRTRGDYNWVWRRPQCTEGWMTTAVIWENCCKLYKISQVSSNHMNLNIKLWLRFKHIQANS